MYYDGGRVNLLIGGRKKLMAETEQMLEDSKTKIDITKMGILREQQAEGQRTAGTLGSGSGGFSGGGGVNSGGGSGRGANDSAYIVSSDTDGVQRNKKLEDRVDIIRHHIEIETRVAEGARNMLKHFLIAQDKKGIQEVR